MHRITVNNIFLPNALSSCKWVSFPFFSLSYTRIWLQQKKCTFFSIAQMQCFPMHKHMCAKLFFDKILHFWLFFDAFKCHNFCCGFRSTKNILHTFPCFIKISTIFFFFSQHFGFQFHVQLVVWPEFSLANEKYFLFNFHREC